MIEMHRLASTLLSDERFRLRSQLERSSSSVADNIAEGYSSYYYNDKIKGMYTARKEAGETQNHLCSVSSKKYDEGQDTERLIGAYEQLIRGINAYVKYLCSKRDRK